MIESFFQLPYLRTVDPVSISVWPLFVVNVFFLLTLAAFGIIDRRLPRQNDLVDRKVHSKFLSRFLKAYWYWLTNPLVKLMILLRMTPNFLTFVGFLISCVAAFFFYMGMVGAGGWIMIFGATFDMFDGQIARITGKESKSGAFFDSVMDRFSEAVVFLGLAFLYRNSWVLIFVLLALVGSLMVSYTRARGEGVGVDVNAGFMQRPERIVYLGVGSIFSPIFAHFISKWFFWTPLDFMTIGALLIIGIFTNLGAIYRMAIVMTRLDPPKPKESEERPIARLMQTWVDSTGKSS